MALTINQDESGNWWEGDPTTGEWTPLAPNDPKIIEYQTTGTVAPEVKPSYSGISGQELIDPGNVTPGYLEQTLESWGATKDPASGTWMRFPTQDAENEGVAGSMIPANFKLASGNVGIIINDQVTDTGIKWVEGYDRGFFGDILSFAVMAVGAYFGAQALGGLLGEAATAAGITETTTGAAEAIGGTAADVGAETLIPEVTTGAAEVIGGTAADTTIPEITTGAAEAVGGTAADVSGATIPPTSGFEADWYNDAFGTPIPSGSSIMPDGTIIPAGVPVPVGGVPLAPPPGTIPSTVIPSGVTTPTGTTTVPGLPKIPGGIGDVLGTGGLLGTGGNSALWAAIIAAGLADNEDKTETKTVTNPNAEAGAATGIELASSLARSGSKYDPYIEKGATLTESGSKPLTDIDINKYLNPYLSAVLDPALRNINEAAANEQIRRSAIAARSGNDIAISTPGVSNMADIQYSLAERERLRSIGDTTAKTYATGYDTATDLATKDLNRQLTAGQDYGSLAKTGGALETGTLDALAAQTRAATPVGQTTTTTLPPPGLIAQTVGALGVYNSLTNPGGAKTTTGTKGTLPLTTAPGVTTPTTTTVEAPGATTPSTTPASTDLIEYPLETTTTPTPAPLYDAGTEADWFNSSDMLSGWGQ